MNAGAMQSQKAAIDAVDTVGLAALTSAIARFPSQIPDEGPFAQYLARYMKELGCYDDVFLQLVVPGRWNVIGTVRGSGMGKTILLNGHLDIPAPTGNWQRDPYGGDVEDGLIYGVGLADMKAAVACMVKGAEAVARGVDHRSGDVIVAAVIHHDVCGLGTKFFLDCNDSRIDFAINGEPTDLALQVAHGGACQYTITTHGTAMHTSRQGDDALRKMLAILNALNLDRLTFEETDVVEGLPRLQVGIIQGGQSASRTAASCTAQVDVRTVPGMTQASLIQDLRAVIDGLTGIDSVSVEINPGPYQRPFAIDDSDPFVELVTDAHALVTDAKCEISRALPMSAYVTDSSDIMRAGIPTVIYGPGDWTGEPDEYVTIEDISTAARVYAAASAQIVSE